MRNPTVTTALNPSYIAAEPLLSADWVLDRLALLGGEDSGLHQQISALKDAALLRGEYAELEAALVALPTGCVAQRLLAKHAGTGKYAAAKLGWVHRGRVNSQRTGMDDWHRLLAACSERREARLREAKRLALGQAKWDVAMAEYRATMRESKRLWLAGNYDAAVDLATAAAVKRADVKVDPDVMELHMSDALRKHRQAAGLGTPRDRARQILMAKRGPLQTGYVGCPVK